MEAHRASIPIRRGVQSTGRVRIVRDGDEVEIEALQQRIHPAASRVKLLAEQTPASFVAFDLLALGDEYRHDVAVNRSDAVTRLHDAAALCSAGYATPADIVRAACDVLADGADGVALAMLAAVPLRTAVDGDVIELLDQALAELGLPSYEQNGTAGQEAALSVTAARVLSGDLDPRSFAAWTHHTFGHDRLPAAERLAELDDEYGTIEYTDRTVQSIDAEVVAEARRLAALTRVGPPHETTVRRIRHRSRDGAPADPADDGTTG